MSTILDWKKYQEKATQAIAEGVVLLENKNGALPLDAARQIAVFGRIQLDYYKSGTGSGGMVNVSHVINIPEGLELRGAKLDQELRRFMRTGRRSIPLTRAQAGAVSPGAKRRCRFPRSLSKHLLSAARRR